jgi:transposase
LSTPPILLTRRSLILDNHSVHISKQTNAWLASQRAGRFEVTFTPTHGSWLNLIEGFSSNFEIDLRV